jgi:hypothetical protein
MEQLQTLAPPRKRLRHETVVDEAPRRNGRVVDRPPARRQAEAEATYRAALELVRTIEHNLTYGLRHYRNKAGCLLLHLDEVIDAILRDDLLLDAQPNGIVEPVQDLVA